MEAVEGQYRISDGVLARSVGDTIVLFHPETERLLTLHETAVRIWQILTEQTDVNEMVARLTAEYEGPEAVIQQQVIEFLSRLEAEQIIRRAS